jgi:AcrR family transcriptional regulator
VPVSQRHATGPPTEQGRERKQQLVEAAVGLIAEHGYAKTHISDICARAGVAKGLFYWYFPTKLDLFAELVRTMRRSLRQAQAAAFRPGDDAVTRIVRGAEASVHFIAEHANYFALVDVEKSDPALAEVLAVGSGVYLDDVVALVREAQTSGQLPDVDPRLIGIGVLGAVSSFSNAWRSGRLDVAPDELATHVGRWVANALR